MEKLTLRRTIRSLTALVFRQLVLDALCRTSEISSKPHVQLSDLSGLARRNLPKPDVSGLNTSLTFGVGFFDQRATVQPP